MVQTGFTVDLFSFISLDLFLFLLLSKPQSKVVFAYFLLKKEF